MGLFRFKKFSVNDEGASMKVGTDAVLLGAWCEPGEAQRILDIGTGCGVIALMLAQRTNASAHIDAVEINQTDADQARENFERSPWPGKLSVLHGPVQSLGTSSVYDLIICNPPFFSRSLEPPDAGRTTARHEASLTKIDLLDTVSRLLSAAGTFFVILPALETDSFVGLAKARNIHLQRHTRFFTRREKPVERSLMAFGREEGAPKTDDLALYASGNSQSEEYRHLTSDFYL